jgi:hypothetical protein
MQHLAWRLLGGSLALPLAPLRQFLPQPVFFPEKSSFFEMSPVTYIF